MDVNEDENLAVEALGQLGNSCRTWTCKSCDVLFFSESEFNDHLNIHEEKESGDYCCTQCPEKFKLKIALDAHELTHLTSETLEYQCEVCLMWFQRLSSLKNHEKVHMPNTLKDFLKKKQKRTVRRLHGRKLKRSNKKEPPSPAFELITNSAYSSEEDNTIDESDHFVDTEYTTHSDSENHQPEEVDNKNLIFANGINNLPDVDPLKPHVCIFCGKKFAREKALLSHMKLHDDNFEAVFLTCTKCDVSFDDFIALQDHVATCIIKKEALSVDSDGSDDYFNPFIEKSTSKKYINSSISKKPKREPGNEDRSNLFRVSSGKYACDRCPKSFKTRQKLFRHVWIHRTKQYTCDTCEAAFYTSVKLQDHKNTFHSPDTPYMCDECGKGYTSLKGLTDHKHYHVIRAQEMICPYCMKKFSSRQGFTIHQRIHTGERPYICEYCSKPFRDGATLRKHELIHTGERPFKCPLCISAFNQKVVLREHIRGVHVLKAKSNICGVCNVEKPDSESLSEHLVKHSDDMRVPLMPRRKALWTSGEVSKGDVSNLVKTIGSGKKGRPKGSKNKISKNLSNKRKVSVQKSINQSPYKQNKKRHELPYAKDYVQEDLYLLNANSAQQEDNTRKKVINRSKNTVVKTLASKSRVSKQKFIKIKKSVNKKGKKSIKTTKRKRHLKLRLNSEETDDISDEENRVQSTIITEQPSVCAMCNERFTSREALLTHVAIHI